MRPANITETTRLMLFVRDAHGVQVDKNGAPITEHCFRVHAAAVLHGLKQEQIIAAALHDTIEDTWVTKAVISDKFGRGVAEIVDTLTRRKSETYFDYIRRVKKKRLAAEVKTLDLMDNLNRERLGEKYDSLTERYTKALEILQTTETGQ